MELTTMYESLGVSRAVYEYGEMILDGLRPRFEAIDRTAEYNQTKVLAAMQKNKLSAGCFAATTGYGYDDMGREVLEKVYADCFHTEAALVRPQITCGTHALAVALSANLLPGDELLSPNGAPYDTLEEVIGIRPSKCSLMEYGVQYRQVDLLPDGLIGILKSAARWAALFSARGQKGLTKRHAGCKLYKYENYPAKEARAWQAESIFWARRSGIFSARPRSAKRARSSSPRTRGRSSA